MAEEYDYAQDQVVEDEEDLGGEIAGLSLKENNEEKKDVDNDDPFAAVEGDGPAQFGNIKPWLGALHEPTNAPKMDTSAPSEDLELEWVHGYNSQAAQNKCNVYFNKQGHIVYPAASVVVVYDPANHSQNHFRDMTDSITCLARSPQNHDFFAAGQVATLTNGRKTNPHICVFDSTNFNKKKIIPNACDRAVMCLTFSPDGAFVAAVGNDDNHTLSIWNWRSGEKIASCKSDGNPVFDIAWNHADESSLVTVGSKHIYFWTLDGNKLTKKMGQMGGKFPMQTFLSVSHSQKGFACAGALDGSLYIFSLDFKCLKMVPQLHDKAQGGRMYSCIRANDGGLVTGGGDGKLHVVSTKMAVTSTTSFSHAVKAVSMSDDGKDLVVGCENASIYLLKNFEDSNNANVDPKSAIVSGHFDGELWSLCLTPDGSHAVTAGEDNSVCLWNVNSRKLVRKDIISTENGPALKVRKACTDSLHPPNQCARAVDFHPSKNEYVLGCNNGSVVVNTVEGDKVSSRSFDLNSSGKRQVVDQKENWIQTIRYSPCGNFCAVGTHGIVVLVLDVNNDYKIVGKGTSSNAAPTHLDWSNDSTVLKVVDRAYEMLFYNVDGKGKLSAEGHSSKFKDTEYATETCPFGWGVRGIFDGLQTGSDVKGVFRSPAGNLIVTGDNYQKVNLFRYPSQGFLDDKANVSQKKAFSGHASHVCAVRFTPDQKRVLSVGGGDKTLIQWAVIKN